MKRFSKIGQILFTTLFVLSISLQGIQPAVAQGGDNVRISRNQHTGKVSFIGAVPGKPIHVQAAQMSGMAASDRALVMFQLYAADLGLTQPGRELMLETTDRPNGRQVSKFQQIYRDIPVMAGELVVDATDQGELLSINGEIAPDLNIDTKATVTAAQATQTALESVAKWYQGKVADFESTQPALWIYDSRLLEPDGSAPALVWRMDVTSQTRASPIRELVLVDAHHGNISLHFNQDDTEWTSNQSMHLDEETPTDTPSVEEPTATDVPTEISPAATDVPTETTIPPTEIATELPITATSIPTEIVAPTILPTTTPTTRGVQAQSGISRYVATTGADTGDCTDSALPCLTINYAIGQAADGDTIKVASGTYTGIDYYVVVITKSVNLSGGWDSGFSGQNGASIIDGQNARGGMHIQSSSSIYRFVVQHGYAGVYIDASGIMVTIGSSTFQNNSSTSALVVSSASLVLSNSTIANNNAGPYHAGGGIYASNATLTILNSTIVNNTAALGGGLYLSSGTTVIRNSIIANNTANGTTSEDCSGSITSDHNIIGNSSGCDVVAGPGDRFNINPQVAPNPIGSLAYYPLLSNSPAIDTANPVTCLAVDERGLDRPQGNACDIGAYEQATPGVAAGIGYVAGSGQHVSPKAVLALPLKTYIVDNAGSPVPAVTVAFTAPVSGPSGTFATTHTSTATAITDQSGIASAPAFTANDQPGSYTVSATVAGLPEQADFSLTNAAWFVAPTGSDSTNSCAVPESPCLTINGAITKAFAGETINVAGGTYTGTDYYVVAITKSVNLSGGWDSSFSRQNAVSIIDGQNARAGMDIRSSSSIDRFVIQHGYAAGGAGMSIGSASTVSVSNSTIRDNVSNGFNSRGGGITIAGANVTLSNSTVAGNSIESAGGFGGGINAQSGNLMIQNSTIANNSADFGGGLSGWMNITLRNSILANNTASAEGSDCSGTVISSGHNIVGKTAGCTVTAGAGDKFNVDPKITSDPIGVIGYYPLLAGSPAINAGSSSGCPARDERGVSRPQGSACDIGSYEYAASHAAISIGPVAGSNQRIAPNAPFSIPLKAYVVDNAGSPVAGITVIFTAPTSGASGTFATTGTNTATAVTNTGGIATAPTFRSNNQFGAYEVTGAVVGLAQSVVFALANAAWFVSSSGDDGANSCALPDGPCLTINGAINKAWTGDKIYVASGTYMGSGTNSIVTISKDITLSGGWDSTFTIQSGTSIIDGQDVRQGISITRMSTVDRFVVQHGHDTAWPGGMGIGIDGSFTVTITNSTIRENVVPSDSASAIVVHGANLILSNSTIANNAGRGISAQAGAALTIRNSTIAENSGGGIYSEGMYPSAPLLTILNSTIVNNSSFEGAGLLLSNSWVVMRNSILANNSASIQAPDCEGTIRASEHNIIGKTSGCKVTPGAGDKFNVNPKIGSNLIGATGYYPLLAGSPAIDAGNPATCLTTDQRGLTRPQGAACDMGAYEYRAPTGLAAIGVVSGSGQSAAPTMAFGQRLIAYVVDSHGSPVVGATVTFTTPSLGASGTFADTGTNTTTAVTNTSGVATAPTLTANTQSGEYAVTATVAGLADSADFALRNGALYVAPVGSDANSCITLDSPCLTINGAMNKAVLDDSILVAAGTYTGIGTGTDPVITVSQNVKLLGGWDSNFAAQNSVSIIDGQNARQGMVIKNSSAIDHFVIQHGYSIVGGAGIQIGTYFDAPAVTITNSTIRDNLAHGMYIDGGGIYIFGGNLALSNSSVTGNIIETTNTGGGGSGGGVFASGSLTIQNSTIANNRALHGGGLSGGNVTIRNTILANNIAMDTGPDCYYLSIKSDHNVISNTAGCPVSAGTGDHFNVDPKISPIPIGAIGYYALLPGSPAIDAGSPTGCPATDERGVPRPQGSSCDIGAFEYGGSGTIPAYLFAVQGAREYTLLGSPSRLSPTAAILDAEGNPVPGVLITFTAPSSGPSGTFNNGTNTIGVMTGNNGLAAPGAFVANRTEGSYTLQATASGLAPVEFSVTNGSQNIKTYTMNHSKDPSKLPGTLLCELTLPGCTGSVNPEADQAESFAYGTYWFYRSKVQRNGLDGAAKPIILSVDYGSDYENSFWDGREAVFGDGWAADDVVAHELTHGVTQYTSGLFYYYQSGAISESLSDLFGELYDQSNSMGSDTPDVKWLIGEDLQDFSLIPYRSMSNPPEYGSPDRVTSGYYDKGEEDNGGVHRNSGVNNKAAYLMVDGGTFNGKTVTALGADKTLAVYYEAQTHLLTSASDYADLYDDLYQACLNLVGGSSGIIDTDCQSVRNALDAVQMNFQPASSYNPEAPVCATGQAPVDQFYDNFESGAGKWSFSTLKGTQRWRFDSPYGPFAHSGTHFLFADDYPAATADVTAQMKTGVKIPANAYLHFAQSYDFSHYINDAYDGGVVEYSADNGATWHDAGSLMIDNGYRGAIASGYGNPLSGRKGFVGTSHGYISSRLNLSSLAGKTVNFRWRMGLDQVGYSWGWWLDDVRIYTCSAPGKISPPHGATNLKATVALSWKPVSGAKSYDYCYDTTNDNACSDWLKHGTSTSVSISGLTPSTKYYWQVHANTASGMIYAGTAWWSFTTGPLPAAFNKSSPVNGTTDQWLNPTLSWNASAAATSYEYCYDTDNNDACDGAWQPTSLSSAILRGLSPNITYYWQVRAINSFGPTEADAGTWFSFTTIPIAYAISGNAGLGGATLSYTDGNPVTAIASGNGDYSFAVTPGWSGVVTPSKAGYIFLPASLPYSNVTEDQISQNYAARQLTTVLLQSAATQDGWILETSENSSLGGLIDAGATTLRLGDDAARKQYRGILSFNTAGLPDNAVITNATLKLGQQAISGGGNPLTMFQGVFIDLRKGFFGSAATLQVPDFQAVASKSVGPFNPTPVGTLYSINLGSPAFPYINKLATNGGLTQLRLRFKLDDNNNTVANFISFYSGNNATAGLRPALVITYYLP